MNHYILVVDDIPDNLLLIQLALEQDGHQLVSVNDGFSALAQIDQCPPDLILLDVMMPRMDGYEVTQKIRQNSRLPYIPILLITAHEQSNVVKGLDTGADDFIRKPVQIDELQARVRSLLRLKQSIDQREHFVHCLTHDLRTPLVAADRMLSLITQGVFGEITLKTKDALNNIIRSNQNLLEMINKLLDVHSYEEGQKKLSCITFNLKNLLEQIITELTPLAQEKALELRCDWQAPLEEIDGDRQELRRVLTNLISNAIKFTDTGYIEVRVSLSVGDNKEDNWLIIEIEDTGIGISSKAKAKIFRRFYHSNHKGLGYGLGLHLCHQIIQEHGGKITLESQLDQGSTFTVGLPIH
ncbi:two-component hybrid sensor and regulator [Crocosphaera subtropica ATCC 51142]|uniref:histidine kinase n=1 Tax=Crocosphaera subtropica (strain ATCC 51142 / BH68) TaxID=43989 RepID=B1WS71_CROS5|nr:hybrid sensor histidine kinase/response regulator [Crocosphaera subtropica]ACB51857.1 two-component hybrid sensor and regulator [Crocosphaera subtropica ATCC 51142]